MPNIKKPQFSCKLASFFITCSLWTSFPVCRTKGFARILCKESTAREKAFLENNLATTCYIPKRQLQLLSSPLHEKECFLLFTPWPLTSKLFLLSLLNFPHSPKKHDPYQSCADSNSKNHHPLHCFISLGFLFRKRILKKKKSQVKAT